MTSGSPPQKAIGPDESPVAPGESSSSSSDVPSRAALVPRLLGQKSGKDPLGSTLICVAAIHGNEPAGVEAARRVLSRLEEDATGLEGRLVAVVGNRQALRETGRFVASDLNRIWRHERVAALKGATGALQAEDQEQLELHDTLQKILRQAQGKVFLLDIHSTSAPGPAFAILEDSLSNRRFAKEFPLPIVLGIEEELAGTLASYVGALGVTVVGFEAGQHQDPRAVDRAEAAIWVALEAAGVLADGARSEVRLARQLLAREGKALPRWVQVRYRYHVDPYDKFQMTPGLKSFEPVRIRQDLATTKQGLVKARRSGLVLMPLYQDQGEDGFFIVTKVHSFWLGISSFVRGLGLDRFFGWLPGVQRHPELAETFVVDRRYARWLAPEMFHLFGFRRIADRGRWFIMTRRTD